MTDGPRRQVRIRIDRLVLSGFAPGDRPAMTRAFVAALQGALGDPAALVRIGSAGLSARLRTASVAVPPGATPVRIAAAAGATLARRVIG